ncbi:uncharacterized protein [Spinacia oleracea]|uniref:Retrovirus-related Pol polyprotein from transposon TNT 1-94-like beta-barrel domain-containing protein n=1 Tax=Spinacia oleracea TaxID=3562 RepID=A0ABM3RS11_SPIOL|nr:uncharacterized protein LOC130471978 [Spinacia oleracea]
MRFYLEQIDVAYVISDVVKPVNDDELHDFEVKFAKDDRTCKGMLLHHMSNVLLDIYMGYNHARDIYDGLEKKYGTDDAGTKRYCVSKWLGFQVEDDKPIIDQIHAYENICIAMAAEGLSICDITLAIVLIEKLPPSWKDIRNQLMHKKKDLTLEELVGHLKIEEENRIKDKGQSVFSKSAKANLAGHKSRDCRVKKKPDQNQAHLVEAVADPNNFIAVVSEANLAGDVAEWIVDTRSTRHICTNKQMFTSYEKTDGENVFMGNSASATVQGKGKIVLTLTFGKTLT